MPNDEGRDAVVVVAVAAEDAVADKPLAEMADVSVTSDAGESLVVVLEPNEGRLAGGGRGGFRARGTNQTGSFNMRHKRAIEKNARG